MSQAPLHGIPGQPEIGGNRSIAVTGWELAGLAPVVVPSSRRGSNNDGHVYCLVRVVREIGRAGARSFWLEWVYATRPFSEGGGHRSLRPGWRRVRDRPERGAYRGAPQRAGALHQRRRRRCLWLATRAPAGFCTAWPWHIVTAAGNRSHSHAARADHQIWTASIFIAFAPMAAPNAGSVRVSLGEG